MCSFGARESTAGLVQNGDWLTRDCEMFIDFLVPDWTFSLCAGLGTL